LPLHDALPIWLLDVQAGARGSAQPGSGSPPRSIGSDHAEARGGLAARQVAAAGGVAAAGAVAGAEVAVAVAGRARRGGLGLGGGTGGVLGVGLGAVHGGLLGGCESVCW